MIWLERAIDDIDFFIEKTEERIEDTKRIIENLKNMEKIQEIQKITQDTKQVIENVLGTIENQDKNKIMGNLKNIEKISQESTQIHIKYETELIEEYKLTIEMLNSIKSLLIDDGDNDEIEYGDEEF